MHGIFGKLIGDWPTTISHNSKHSEEKQLRYSIGTERLSLLRANAQFFAYADTDQGRIGAFLCELDEFDLDPRMPESTRFEYLAGREADGEVMLFAYLWFSSLKEAKAYVLRHSMTFVGGWNRED